MNREFVITAVIYAVLAILAATSWFGLGLALGWLGVGCWFIAKTRSRGFIADVSFAATWPLYVITGK